MYTLYAPEKIESIIPDYYKMPKIFLAGPTPRHESVESFRPHALEIFKAKGFSGIIMLPEPRSGQWGHSYDDQIDWEDDMRELADVIMFWVPRDMSIGINGAPKMPALTTNVEFGLDLKTGKIVYGRPDHAPSCKYLDQKYRKFVGNEPINNLEGVIDAACLMAHEKMTTKNYLVRTLCF